MKKGRESTGNGFTPLLRIISIDDAKLPVPGQHH